MGGIEFQAFDCFGKDGGWMVEARRGENSGYLF